VGEKTAMSPQSKVFSLPRARLVTIIVVFAVAAGIALANLASEPVSGDLIKRLASNPTRAYGWPLTWYWRMASAVPGTIPTADGSPPRSVLEWPIARYSARGLAANFAMWLLFIAGSAAVCQRFLRKYEPRLTWRPRVSTLVILLAAAAPTVLANMTFDVSSQAPQLYLEEPGATAKASFGWPLVWHWYLVAPLEDIYGWDFSAARLAGNMALWLGTLALVAITWEWLLRRYRPRLRISLRAMLAATALVAVLCAWCAAISNRADEQDALAASRWRGHHLWVERFGPKWFGLVIPDRYRRCVVGARINIRTETTPEDEDLEDVEVVKRLAQLPGLRFLAINYGVLTPAVTDALAELRHVRGLQLQFVMRFVDWRATPANLAWLGNLRQLDQLSLPPVVASDLACLTSLTRLESLTLDLSDCDDDEPEMDKRLAAIGKLTSLNRLYLHGSPGAQIAHLGSLNRLKLLALDFERFNGDGERFRACFAAIGKLTQVEDLRLAAEHRRATTPLGALLVRADDLASLRGMKKLSSLKLIINCDKSESQACLAAIGRLTQIRRLWLSGNLVAAGLAELAPLQSLEELTSEHGLATPAGIESLVALKHLKTVEIPGLTPIDVVPADSLDPASSPKEAEGVRRALESLRRSHPGIAVNEHNQGWWDDQTEHNPWFAWQQFDDETTDLDSFLAR
jgi:hypothetical protein